MSIKDGKDYLYLIWKSNVNGKQYIVGQLTKNGQYEFQYCKEHEEAIEAGFKPLVSFENPEKIYTCNDLFPVFASRLPDRKRKDIDKILKKYGLEEFDAYELLKMSGAKLPIDSLYFIDPILNFDKSFEKSFYLAGARHYLGCEGVDCTKAIDVTRGDEVFLKREKDNAYDHNAIRVENDKAELLGYIPRYYAEAFVRLMEEGRVTSCHIVNVDMNQSCDECIEVVIKIV